MPRLLSYGGALAVEIQEPRQRVLLADIGGPAIGGREALLDYLLGYDLSTVNLRQIPKTAALLDQKIASLPPEKGWLLDPLGNGQLPSGCSEDNECPVDALFDSYVQHASRQGARRRSIETAIGCLVKKDLPDIAAYPVDHLAR